MLDAEDLVYNRLALVTKTRLDGTFKTRLAWGRSRSGASGSAFQVARIILQRLSDLVEDASYAAKAVATSV